MCLFSNWVILCRKLRELLEKPAALRGKTCWNKAESKWKHSVKITHVKSDSLICCPENIFWHFSMSYNLAQVSWLWWSWMIQESACLRPAADHCWWLSLRPRQEKYVRLICLIIRPHVNEICLLTAQCHTGGEREAQVWATDCDKKDLSSFLYSNINFKES